MVHDDADVNVFLRPDENGSITTKQGANWKGKERQPLSEIRNHQMVIATSSKTHLANIDDRSEDDDADAIEKDLDKFWGNNGM